MSPEVLEVDVTGVTHVQASIHAGSDVTPAPEVNVTDVTAGPAPGEKEEGPIPGEKDRPCFRVLDDWTEVDGGKLKAGVWSFGIRHGKNDNPPTQTQHWVCSPLHIDALTTDEHGGNYGRLLRFRTTTGEWRKFAMPMELLKADGADLRGELLSMGVEIDPVQRNALAMYLQHRAPKQRILCALRVGWANPSTFVLPDEVIGPRATGVVFQAIDRVSSDYTSAGTLQGWQAEIAARAVGNPVMTIALCAGFAGPLLERCGAESGGIHLVGNSSTGKSTAVDAACSIWGGRTFRKSWRATANGIEGVAAMMSDSMLALDEISECDPREVGAIVYQLGNGVGKQRANRIGGARPVQRWRTSVLSSGEQTIGTTMAAGGHRIKAGQTVRLLDVPVQRKYGAWDNLHGSESGCAFSDAVKTAALQHYGHAGRAFLQRLTRDKDTSLSLALEKIKTLPEFCPDGDDGQVRRVGARFALLALASELATGYRITGWPEREALKAAATAFQAWQHLRGAATGGIEKNQVVEKVSAFIERHGDARFSDVAADREDAPVRDRAGWWRGDGDDRAYLFTKEGLREALVGFDFSRALDVLQDLGAIEKPGADGVRARPVRIGGRVVRLYGVLPAALAKVAR